MKNKIIIGIGCAILIIVITVSIVVLKEKKDHNPIQEKQATSIFVGTVLEIGKNSLIIEPNIGEKIRNSSDKISVNVPENSITDWKVGQMAKVTYTGDVRTTYPAQINIANIEHKKTVPEKYEPEEAVEDGCFVNVHDKIYNKNKWIDFVEKIKNKEVAEIRMIQYTIEGDAMVYDIRYENNTYMVWEDNRRDKFASEEDRKIHYQEYNEIGQLDNRFYLYQGNSLTQETPKCYLYSNQKNKPIKEISFSEVEQYISIKSDNSERDIAFTTFVGAWSDAMVDSISYQQYFQSKFAKGETSQVVNNGTQIKIKFYTEDPISVKISKDTNDDRIKEEPKNDLAKNLQEIKVEKQEEQYCFTVVGEEPSAIYIVDCEWKEGQYLRIAIDMKVNKN